MKIGELANRVGVNPKTIRFYEDKGLLPAPARRPSGYREYGEQDVTRLSFIRTAQRLDFNLAEIAEILAFKERGERPCDYVLSVLIAQLSDVDRRLGELVALRAELGLPGAHPMHLDITMDQLGPLRPTRALGDHHTPVIGLLLAGAGSSPTGGISGLPGRNAARRLLADWRRTLS